MGGGSGTRSTHAHTHTNEHTVHVRQTRGGGTPANPRTVHHSIQRRRKSQRKHGAALHSHVCVQLYANTHAHSHTQSNTHESNTKKGHTPPLRQLLEGDANGRTRRRTAACSTHMHKRTPLHDSGTQRALETRRQPSTRPAQNPHGPRQQTTAGDRLPRRRVPASTPPNTHLASTTQQFTRIYTTYV